MGNNLRLRGGGDSGKAVSGAELGWKFTPRMPPPDPKVMRWFEAWNSTLCAIFYAQLGKADGLEMDEFMLKYNVDPYGENDHPFGESEARMAGFGLGQADMLASRDRLQAGQQSTDAQLDAQHAWHIEHGGHGGPPMSTHVASAQLAQVDEVVQPKRQRNDYTDAQRAADVMPLVFEQGVWFRRSRPATDSIERAK